VATHAVRDHEEVLFGHEDVVVLVVRAFHADVGQARRLELHDVEVPYLDDVAQVDAPSRS
jgi:hypothetical protein